jgi:hypothetical protein
VVRLLLLLRTQRHRGPLQELHFGQHVTRLRLEAVGVRHPVQANLARNALQCILEGAAHGRAPAVGCKALLAAVAAAASSSSGTKDVVGKVAGTGALRKLRVD